MVALVPLDSMALRLGNDYHIPVLIRIASRSSWAATSISKGI
jgi:hypothetical protein